MINRKMINRKMINRKIFLILSFTAIASALNSTLTHSLFSIAWDETFAYQMFQTRSGIIGYHFEDESSQKYYQIDKSHNVSIILSDLVKVCEQAAATGHKLHYHLASSTLAYYCTKNNTLLFLDENDYSIQGSISTNMSDTFTDVKLTSDGSGLALLLTSYFFQWRLSTSQLFRINLQSRTISSNVTLHTDAFVEGEFVTGYASSTMGLCVLTNKIGSSNNTITVYAMTLNGTSPQFTELAKFYSSYEDTIPINDIYTIGNYIVVNNAANLIVLTWDGQVVKQIPNLYVMTLPATFPKALAYVAYVVEYGASTIYALSSNNTILKISVNAFGTWSSVPIGTAGNMWVAVAGPLTNSLLLTSGMFFNITDLHTLEVTYTTYSDPANIFITNSTYSIPQDYINLVLFIFDSKTDLLIKTVDLPELYYYDANNSLIAYMLQDGDKCHLALLDLQTGSIGLSDLMNSSYICNNGHVTQHRLKNGFSEFVIMIPQSEIVIVSPSIGQVNLGISESSLVSAVVNFDQMDCYLLDGNTGRETNISYYQYNDQSQQFEFQSSYLLDNAPTEVYTGYESGQVYGFILTRKQILIPISIITTIDLVNEFAFNYTFPDVYRNATLLQDNDRHNYLILSDLLLLGDSGMPNIYDLALSTSYVLPGTNSQTLTAATGGRCSYWVLNAIKNVQQIQFFDICSHEAATTEKEEAFIDFDLISV